MNKIKQTLKNLFIERQDEYFAQDIALKKIYTYKDFINLALNYRQYLQEKGLSKSGTVCYTAQNSIYSLALYIAVLLLNAKIALIDPLKGEEESKEIIRKISPCTIVTLEELSNIQASWQEYDKYIFDNIDFRAPFLITFTSGSTGEAKGVIHSFENLFLSAFDFGKLFNLNEKNIFFHNFPMAYMAGVLNTFIKPLIFGSKIIVAPRLCAMSAMHFWDDIIANNINTFWINPTFVSMLLKLDRSQKGVEYAKNNKITAFCGTAPLDKNIKQKFEQKYGFKLYESYGLSETLFLTTNYPGSDAIDSPGIILDSVDLKIDDNNEISVKAPWMFLGYLGKDDSFAGSYFKTGDLGKIAIDDLQAKRLFITGRSKDIIIKGGVNISPKKIGDIVSNYCGDFTIIGLKDVTLGEKIACFYTGNLDEKNINSIILAKLGKDYLIDVFYKLNEIPKNTNGKTDKIKLKKEYEK